MNQLGWTTEAINLVNLQQYGSKRYIKTPTDLTKQILDVATAQVDLHNLEIEIVAQKNIFVDSYIYYKEDFLKRYKNQSGKKKSVFKK